MNYPYHLLRRRLMMASEPYYTVTITGTGSTSSNSSCYVQIKNTKYTSPTILKVKAKTQMITQTSSGLGVSGGTYLNGSAVASAGSQYSYTIISNITVKLEPAQSIVGSYVRITTE